jgi:hypothetical protein
VKHGHIWIGISISLALLIYLSLGLIMANCGSRWHRQIYPIADRVSLTGGDSGDARMALAIPAQTSQKRKILELDVGHSHRIDGQYDSSSETR